MNKSDILNHLQASNLEGSVDARIRYVLDAFPEDYNGTTWPFSPQRRLLLEGNGRPRSTLSIPVKVEPVNPYPGVSGTWEKQARTLSDMRYDSARGLHRVEDSQPTECIHWSAHANNMFRAWHDSLHVKYNKRFTLEEEVILAHLFSTEHPSSGFIHWIETVVPSLVYSFTGKFPGQGYAYQQEDEGPILRAYYHMYGAPLGLHHTNRNNHVISFQCDV